MNTRISPFAKTIGFVVALLLGITLLSSCDNDSDVASKNLSTDADNFKVFRQIVVYNAITDKYILEVEGYCALGNHDPDDQVSYVCKVPNGMASDGFVKDIIKKSDNTFVFVHQLEPVNVSTDFYKVTLKPTEIIPDFQYNG